MADIVIAAMIAAVAALGAPWMNALATRWLESKRQGKKQSRTPSLTQPPNSSSNLISLIAMLAAAPSYAMAGWAFLVSPSLFHDEGILRGLLAVLFAFVFVIIGYYSREWILKSAPPPQSN